MKTILVLLALFAISQAFQPAGGFNEQDVSVIQKEPYKSLVDFAQRKAIEKAVAEGALPSNNFTFSRVLGLSTQVVAGLNVKIVLELTDANGGHKYANILVFSQPWTKTLRLESYTITNEPSLTWLN